MSAWLVSRAHIDALVGEATRHNGNQGSLSYFHGGEWHHVNRHNAADLGQMLWNENVNSLAARYPNDPPEDVSGYTVRPSAVDDPVTLLKAIDCYEYQSCEHDAWESSEAYAVCQALRDQLIHRLPGYDAAPWGIDEHAIPEPVYLNGRR